MGQDSALGCRLGRLRRTPVSPAAAAATTTCRTRRAVDRLHDGLVGQCRLQTAVRQNLCLLFKGRVFVRDRCGPPCGRFASIFAVIPTCGFRCPVACSQITSAGLRASDQFGRVPGQRWVPCVGVRHSPQARRQSLADSRVFVDDQYADFLHDANRCCTPDSSAGSGSHLLKARPRQASTVQFTRCPPLFPSNECHLSHCRLSPAGSAPERRRSRRISVPWREIGYISFSWLPDA